MTPPTLILHPSTMGALSLTETLHEEGLTFANIIDMGCGAGTISLQLAAWWPQSRIIACDISAKAVADARTHFASNGMSERVDVVRSDGYTHPDIDARAPYDLIVSNLLADHHQRLAHDVQNHLAQGGMAVLSGILAWLMPPVREAYEALGMTILAQAEIGEWQALLLRKE